MKIDAVPGITRTTGSPPTLGGYPVVCAELCGLGHAAMRQTAHADGAARLPALAGQRRQDGRSRPQAEQRRRRPAPAVARPTARRSSPRTAAARATRSRTPGRPAAPARTSTTSSPNKDAAFIEESITDPGAEIAPGYSDGIMPTNFGQTL